MDRNLNGWFTEMSPMWPGQATSLKVKEILLHKKSKFQDIKIFESTDYGRVLLLDGIIQATERDEAAYQEMITFLPLNSHPNPEKVLVVGGGDGGVLREMAKHPKVKEIYHCEIDEEVIAACKEFIPSMACGFDNPNIKSFTGDGAAFLENTEEKFDIIITDASDPVSGRRRCRNRTPANTLFNDEYYGKMKAKLRPGGILCCQGENMWLHSELISHLMETCRKEYPVVDYAYTCVPTYPGGQIGFILCSLNKELNNIY
ncbi:Spermidine synthase [Armadillidium nasatum]|uniref:Spermidine synthase n=1 Tax=Armadillidium nasatum TaxID=96803 RepID=A0A5N5SLF4_9CRUS|nr:Spermidine synthase [Armadillidium nasatum]